MQKAISSAVHPHRVPICKPYYYLDNTSITNHRIRAVSFSSKNKIPHVTKGHNEKINSITNTVTDNKVADSSGSSITPGKKDGKKNEGNVSHATSENTNYRLRAASFSSKNKIPHVTKGHNEKINSMMNTVTDNKVADSSGSCITAGEKDGKKNEGNASHAILENTSITNHRLCAVSFSSENKIPHITKGHNGKINSTMNTVTDNKVANSSGSCITAGEKDGKKNEGNVSHATSEKTSDQAGK